MTEEHVPPKSSGNRGPGAVYTESDGALVVLREYAEGHSVRSLCKECNNAASRRGLPQAYTAWRDDVAAILQRAGAAYAKVNHTPANDLWKAHSSDGPMYLPMNHGTGVKPDQINNLHPGRIARQLLGMLLAVQGNRNLRDDNPQLVEAYFSDEPTSIESFAMHVALCNAGLGYTTGPATAGSIHLDNALKVDRSDCWFLSFAPFVIVLTRGPKSPIVAKQIDGWLSQGVGQTFSKHDRRVQYPIADQRELLVNWLYGRGV